MVISSPLKVSNLRDNLGIAAFPLVPRFCLIAADL